MSWGNIVRLVPVLSVVVLLGACGDPLAGVGRVSEADIVDTAPAAAALASADEVEREAFFGTDAAKAGPQVTAASAPATEPVGFLRKLARRAAEANPEAVAAAQAQSEPVIIETRPTVSASVEYAALPAAEAEPPAPREQHKARGFGLFGLGGSGAKKDAPRNGPDSADVPYGTVLAFGQIARVCEAKGKSLGAEVAGSGKRGFSLYDSSVGTRDKRTFYITGFADGCPRQFTAANALLGAPTFYEEIRFGPTGQFMTLAATDTAYDGIKSKVCRVSKNKPCGAQIDKLDKSTVFVSAYEFSEENSEWKEFLVHDGEVLASALK